MTINRLALTACAALALFAPAAASAQAAPGFVVAQVEAPRFIKRHDVQGRITYFNAYTMTVLVHRRSIPVVLHQGTVINPRGATLRPGMIANVHGHFANGNFYASRIDIIV